MSSATAIVIADLRLPKNVEMKENKTSVTFVRGNKKAVLKGRALEITNPIKELGKRVERYSDDVIQNCHLGNIKAVIRGVKDTVDLQGILKKYYK
jgi:hypothetical protein